MVLVHGKRCGVLLRGGAPVWGTDVEGMNEYRSALENQIAMSGREILFIGRDFSANVGRGKARRGVCGKYGVGRMNETDE